MTTHAARPGQSGPLCGAVDGELVPLDEALSEDGRHFDCRECLRVLRDGQRHARPE